MTSIYSKFKEIVQSHASKPAVYYFENNKQKSLTYQDLSNQVDRLSAGLQSLQVKPNSHIAIMLPNSPQWLISDLSINKLSAVSVPIHTTSNANIIQHITTDALINVIIISEDLYEKHSQLLSAFQFLKTIILTEKEIKKEDRIFRFKDILNTNHSILDSETQSENPASIVYTSGTTGNPKGVVLTNKNLLANISAASREYNISTSDVFLSLLPLSHILERTLGSYIPILKGATIHYSSGIKFIREDLKKTKPTILIAVPKIFERFYEKIQDNAKNSNGISKKIFYWALKNKENPIAQFLVFKKIRNLFGGNIRFCVAGGASLNKKILKFFTHSLVPICEGYGLTETSPIISANRINKIIPGSVGQALPGVEIKISQEKEILVKGPNVMKSYWQNKEKTSQAFTTDGWFKTGDQGHLDSDGNLTIIGRAKDVIVTSNGKNISPENLESLLNLSPQISQSMVVGHKRSSLSALIVPSENLIDAIDAKKIIQKEIDALNKTLEPHEWIRNFELISTPFSQENNQLTPTLKLKRFTIENYYKKQINKL